ncbi:MAG TPA: ABC transporter permease [Thermoanaerobaculia bacterium]|nr:ABC transporter permease [Thermoanaerobaculia bacterium]
MNTSRVKHLIHKDWHFFRGPIVAYIAAGLLSLFAIGKGGDAAFYIGSILLITVVISIGIHLVMLTVVQERSEQNLAFVMSLPVSAKEYTAAKVLANLLIFSLAWVILVIGTVAVIAGRGAIPDGLIPFAVVLLGYLFTSYCLTLGVAIVTESQGWTIGAMVLGNLLLQGVMYGVSHAPGMAQDFAANAIVWRQPITGLLGVELAAILLTLGLTFYLQSRKTDFL